MGLAEWCRGTLNPLGSELAATMSQEMAAHLGPSSRDEEVFTSDQGSTARNRSFPHLPLPTSPLGGDVGSSGKGETSDPPRSLAAGTQVFPVLSAMPCPGWAPVGGLAASCHAASVPNPVPCPPVGSPPQGLAHCSAGAAVPECDRGINWGPQGSTVVPQSFWSP